MEVNTVSMQQDIGNNDPPKSGISATNKRRKKKWYYHLIIPKHMLLKTDISDYSDKRFIILSILQKTNIFNSGIYYLICLLSWLELISNFILFLQHLLCTHFLYFLHLHVISLHSTCICLFSSWFLHLVLSIAQLWWLDSWKWGILAF